MTPEQLEQLAFNIRRRGPRWAYLLPHLREVWAALKRGEEAGENALRIRGALRLGKMAIGTRCPECPPPAEARGPEPARCSACRTAGSAPARSAELSG